MSYKAKPMEEKWKEFARTMHERIFEYKGVSYIILHAGQGWTVNQIRNALIELGFIKEIGPICRCKREVGMTKDEVAQNPVVRSYGALTKTYKILKPLENFIKAYTEAKEH